MPHASSLYRHWMFVLGILATLSYRLIVVFNHYSPALVQITWYLGTMGFVWYFSHRFRVENRRDRLITDLGLADKIKFKKSLSEAERSALVYVLEGLQTSLAKWNYITIFVLSALALLYGLYSDFLIYIF